MLVGSAASNVRIPERTQARLLALFSLSVERFRSAEWRRTRSALKIFIGKKMIVERELDVDTVC